MFTLEKNHLMIKIMWLSLLILILMQRFITAPPIENLFVWLGEGTFWWFLESFFLLIFVVVIKRGSIKGLSYFCFMLLLYFCFYVMAAWDPDLVDIVFGTLKALLVSKLFIISMIYIRQAKKAQAAK